MHTLSPENHHALHRSLCISYCFRSHSVCVSSGIPFCFFIASHMTLHKLFLPLPPVGLRGPLLPFVASRCLPFLPLLPVVAHCPPLPPVGSCCFPLLHVASHCLPLLPVTPIASRCSPLLPLTSLCLPYVVQLHFVCGLAPMAFVVSSAVVLAKHVAPLIYV